MNTNKKKILNLTNLSVKQTQIITYSRYSCYTEKNKIVKIKYITLKQFKSFYNIII